MTRKDSTRDNPARRAVLDLLASGHATPSEAAEAAGVSRQLVRYWIKEAKPKLNWRRARETRIAREWRKALKR